MEKKAKRSYTSEEKAEAVALAEELRSGAATSRQLYSRGHVVRLVAES